MPLPKCRPMRNPLLVQTATGLALVAALAATGCKKPTTGVASSEDGRTIRDTRLVLEKCDDGVGAPRALDADGDGQSDVIEVERAGQVACRRVDLDLDGRMDRTTFFAEGGAVRRIESDYDRDGVVDEIMLFEGAGTVREKQRVTMPRGQLDTWEFYKAGKLVATERDQNGDGVIDQWWEYPTEPCPLIHSDVNRDGRPDPAATIDYCKETGYVPPAVEITKNAPRAFDAQGSGAVEELSNEAAPAVPPDDAAEPSAQPAEGDQGAPASPEPTKPAEGAP